MATGVNLYELMHEFWKENDYEPFPSSAIALFFFLLDRANSRHWQMPVKCPTSLICRAINVSKQTALAAREALLGRGLLVFDKGTGKDRLPSYIIVTDPEKWTDNLTDNFTENLTHDLTPDHTDNHTQYNMKDKNIKNKISSINRNGEEKILSLDDLEDLFKSDNVWQADLLSLLSKEVPDVSLDLRERITFFFRQLRCKGIDRREEKDCRSHFVNWINKQIKPNNYGITETVGPDKRRGSAITATSARDYEGAF